jgi:hypothetical protein
MRERNIASLTLSKRLFKNINQKVLIMPPPQRLHDRLKLVNNIAPNIRGKKAARMKTSRNWALRDWNLQFFAVLRCVLAICRQRKAWIKETVWTQHRGHISHTRIDGILTKIIGSVFWYMTWLFWLKPFFMHFRSGPKDMIGYVLSPE